MREEYDPNGTAYSIGRRAGAAAERTSIVAWLSQFAANMQETEADILCEVILSIERGDHATSERS